MTSKTRFVAVFLVVVFAFSLVSCGEKAPVDVFGGFISAVRSCDEKTVRERAAAGASVERFSTAIASSDDYGRETLKGVYSLVKYTVISANVERDEAGSEVVIADSDRQTVRVELSCPDFAALMSLTTSEVLFSSKRKIEIMRDFLDDGTVGRYMKKTTVDVVLIKEDGEWKLPLSQKDNSSLCDLLRLDSFAPWLLG